MSSDWYKSPKDLLRESYFLLAEESDRSLLAYNCEALSSVCLSLPIADKNLSVVECKFFLPVSLNKIKNTGSA